MYGKLSLIIFFVSCFCHGNASNIFCYYNSSSHYNNDVGHMNYNHIIPALQYCTHLIYGTAKINHENYTVEPLNERLDVILKNYGNVISLKRRFPELKVLLSVGGEGDREHLQKYETLLEDSKHRTLFVSSLINTLRGYGFDGVDLAYNFPKLPPKVVKGFFKRIWHKVKNFFVGEKEVIVDEFEAQHKEQFTDLVSYLKLSLTANNLMLMVSVLPNVNSTAYMDVNTLRNHVDYVNLLAFDYQTPERVPKEADYSAPLHHLDGRRLHDNGHYWINELFKYGLPANKLVFGLPAFVRTWSLSKSKTTPPAKANGAGKAGEYTLQDGILSRYEVCNNDNITQVIDPIATNQVYGYILPKDDENGMWMTYDETASIYEKLDYVKANKIGGVSIYDLSMDDFNGYCNGGKYPFLRKVFSHMFR